LVACAHGLPQVRNESHLCSFADTTPGTTRRRACAHILGDASRRSSQELLRLRTIIDSPPLGLSDKCVNSSGSWLLGRGDNANRRKRQAATTVISVNANCAPMQALGPAPKGKYANGAIFLSFSPRKRSASNRSGSGNHRASRWLTY